MLLEKSLTGYNLKKLIEDGIGIFYKASYGSLYPALKKLSSQGLVTITEQPHGNRRRIFYHITEEGRNDFYKWLSEPIDIYEGTNSHLSRVYFFDKLPLEIREQKLMEYEINNKNYLQKLESLEKEFDKMENKDCFYYKLSTLYYGICVTQKTIQWCSHIRNQNPLRELIEERGDNNDQKKIAYDKEGNKKI
jgi:DNA-binding PadR family transcriptional regulator